MKKILILLLLSMLTLSACSYTKEPLPEATTTPEPTTTTTPQATAKPSPSSTSQSLDAPKDIFYIQGNNLIYNSKKIKLPEFNLEKHQYGPDIFHQITEKNKSYIYFSYISECGGCEAVTKKYIIYNHETNSAEIKELNEDIKIFNGWLGGMTLFSPSQKHILVIDHQSARTFNFTNQNEQVIYKLKENEQFGKYGIGCHGLCGEEGQWISNNKLILRYTNAEKKIIEKIVELEPYSEKITTGFIADEHDKQFNYYEDTIIPFDINNDGIQEYAVMYQKDDNRKNQILKVYMLKDNKWQAIKHDIAANQNVAVEKFIKEVKKIDLGDDGNEEIFVHTEFGVRSGNQKYYIFGKTDEGYEDLAISKGYLHGEKYLKKNELFFSLKKISVGNTEITEKYDVYCKVDPPPAQVEFHSKSYCRSFTLKHRYDGGKFTTTLVE